MSLKSTLIELFQTKALQRGQFTLASGRQSTYYLDAKKVTLDPRGQDAIGRIITQLLENLGGNIDAIGGMSIGADPIVTATQAAAFLLGDLYRGFLIRKQTKDHGTKVLVEGPVEPFAAAVIVEDVLTTGGSALEAIRAAENFGMIVKDVIVVVDRMEGGKRNLEDRGYRVHSLLTIQDLGIEPPAASEYATPASEPAA